MSRTRNFISVCNGRIENSKPADLANREELN